LTDRLTIGVAEFSAAACRSQYAHLHLTAYQFAET